MRGADPKFATLSACQFADVSWRIATDCAGHMGHTSSCYVYTKFCIYSASQKNPPLPAVFWHFFPNGWEF